MRHLSIKRNLITFRKHPVSSKLVPVFTVIVCCFKIKIRNLFREFIKMWGQKSRQFLPPINMYCVQQFSQFILFHFSKLFDSLR